MSHEQIQQIIDGRVSDYVTPAQVDAQAATRLTKSALATDANRYISKSEVGSTYASLVNGALPASQRPNDSRTLYLELENHWIPTMPNSASTYGTTPVSCGTFTVGDPGYQWLPYIWGTFEVNVSSGTPPIALNIEDSSGTRVAGGVSTVSNETTYQRIDVSPILYVPTVYIGSRTFTYRLSFTEGSGRAWITNLLRNITVVRGPWAAQ